MADQKHHLGGGGAPKFFEIDELVLMRIQLECYQNFPFEGGGGELLKSYNLRNFFFTLKFTNWV